MGLIPIGGKDPWSEESENFEEENWLYWLPWLKPPKPVLAEAEAEKPEPPLTPDLTPPNCK